MRLSMSLSASAASSSKGNTATTTTPSRPTHRRPRSEGGGVSMQQQQQVPIPVSVQLYNLFPGYYNLPEEPSLNYSRLDYSTQLLRPVRAEIVQVAPRSRADDPKASGSTGTKILYTFPSDDPSCCSVSPYWTHLSDAIDWETLDRRTFDRIHMRFRLEPSSSSSSSSSSDKDNDDPYVYFVQVALHPFKLIPLQKDLPPDRPINTALVHFSDESIRITPQIFELMKHQTLGVVDDQTLRFEEDAFEALDDVAPNASPGSLLDAAEEFEASASSALAIHATSTEVSVEMLPTPRSALQRLLEEVSHLPTENSTEISDLQRERDKWRNAVLREQHAVEAAKQAWEADGTIVRDTLQTLKTKRDHVLQIQLATVKEELECRRLEMHLEAQQIRLVKELRQIYPVMTTDGKAWRICGLLVPRDLFSVSEDDLSAALGFFCHAVSLLSQFLSVPLRYRLFCRFSRSAVLDDRGTIFPLYQARPVEREPVENGVLLLERNIECIGSSRGVQWETESKSSMHILEKLNVVYQIVIEGNSDMPQ